MGSASTEGTHAESPPRSESDDSSDNLGLQPLSKDEVFDTLRASRRRAVLRFLDENGGAATTGTLAEHIAAEENGVDVQSITSSQRKRVYIALYQAHLPRMDDYGLVEYDSDRGDVRLCERADRVLSHLYHDPETPDSADGEQDGRLADVLASLRRLLGRS